MRLETVAGVAAAFCLGITVSAQQNGAAQRSTDAQLDAKQPMTVVGCLVRESDYRRTHKLGKGALGGLGLGDEFVLVNATRVSGTSSSGAGSPSVTADRCAESGTGDAYRLTGKKEDGLKRFVGRWLEVTGTFDHERDAKTAAGQTNAKLPAEIKIASFREASASASGSVASSTETPRPSVAPPSSPAPASTEARNESRAPLPKTASNLPLVGLIGLISLAAVAGLRLWRLGAL
jgi:hypothetical protein